MSNYIMYNPYGSDIDPGPVNTWGVYECSKRAQQALLDMDKPYIRKATRAEIRRYRRSGDYNPYYLPEELEDK